MKTRGILFSAPMVRALLAGTKTQTRRIYKPREGSPYEVMGELPDGKPWPHWTSPDDGPEYHPVRCPYGEPGDEIYVKETWAADAPDLDTCRRAHEDALAPGASYGPYYLATETAPEALKWRSPLFMPRWASRITLAVVDVRVERLQEISEDDAQAEGVKPLMMDSGSFLPAYEGLWGSLSGKKPGCSWADNPWVWVVKFEVTP